VLNQVINVRPFQCAVGDARLDRLTLFRSGEAVEHRTVPTSDPPSQTVGVPSTTLDTILSDLQHCDFLKIDVEGAEYRILFGASDDTLARVSRVCLEYHDGVTEYSHADLLRFFENKGFRVKTRVNPVHPHLGLIYAWK
jgi:FkbM family methyltransferase